MDLNTRELYKKNAREIFRNIELHQDLNDIEFLEIFEKVVEIKVRPIRNDVLLMIANQLFLFKKFNYSFQIYKHLPIRLLNFFELMSFLDSAVLTGQVQERKQIIEYAIEKIIKEKKVNLINEFKQKLKALRVEDAYITKMLARFVLISGDSSYLESQDVNILKFEVPEKLLGKLDFWKKDERILKALRNIDKQQYESLDVDSKDKIKFYCLGQFHRELVQDLSSFDWLEYIDFCLVVDRAIGYEEVNRIVFDFNVEIPPVKIIELKSLKAQNEKMDQVEYVMGDIGLNENFESEELEQVSLDVNINEIVEKIELRLEKQERSFLKEIVRVETTQALEYVKFLNPTEVNLILDEIKSKVSTFTTADNTIYIQNQVNRAYIFIKIAIFAKQYGRAFKMLDFVISEYPLSRSESAAFGRLKRELKEKWKQD